MLENQYKQPLFYHICLYPYLKFEDIYKFLLQAVCGNVHIIESKENFVHYLYKEIDIIKNDLKELEKDQKKQEEINKKIKDDLNKDIIEKTILYEFEIEKEPLIEYLRKDKKYVRVNLRPFLLLQYDLSVLIEACISSAENNKQKEEYQKEQFIRIWNEFSKSVFDESFYDDYEKFYKKLFTFSPISKNRTKEFFKINLALESLEKFNYFIKNKNYPLIHHSNEYLLLYKPAYRVLELKELISKLKLNS